MIGVLTSHKTSSHGALTHDVRKTQRLAVYVFRPDHRACLGIVAGRALSGLPVKPTPQLRGPRSTTSPRSRPGKLVELDAFGVPSSPRGRCHSQKRGCTLRPSGSVIAAMIAAGCRGLPQRERRRRHRGRVQRRGREDLGERGDLRAAQVEQGQERLGWAGLLRAAAAASVIKHNAWLRVLAAQRSASRLRSIILY